MFAHTVTEFWQKSFLSGDIAFRDDTFSVAVDADLGEDRRVMVLEATDGKVTAAVTPAVAERLGLDTPADLTEQLFRRKLDSVGIRLHGADYVFYFAEADQAALRQEADGDGVRRLTEDDAALFAEFESSASEQDLDDAYVELDHWAVFGAVDQGRLVAAASMYPWGGARLADTGVLTLPAFRGRGHARRLVRAISRHAYDQGYEPQYRCQLDNEGSVALAKAAGLTLFGKWDVVSSESDDAS